MQSKKITLDDNKITAENFAEFITLVYQNKINSAAAQLILEEMAKTGADPSHVMDDKDLGQMEDGNELGSIIDDVISCNPDQVADYKAGKEPVIKFLVGQVMKQSKGKANPVETEKQIKKKLK